MTGGVRPALAHLAAAALVVALASGAAAQENAPPPGGSELGRSVADLAALAAERAFEKARREDRLRSLEGGLRENASVRGRLREEIAGLRADRARLAGALVAAAAGAAAAETRMAAGEDRLERLSEDEVAIRRSLADRRGRTADILAALQRLARHPPPALLARPDDVLSAVRGATLMSSALPGLQAEARKLTTDLGELARLRSAMAAERRALEGEAGTLARERDRLAVLVQARQDRLTAAETEFGGVRARSEALGGEASSLQGLIDRLGQELEAARRGAEAAQQAAAAEARQVQERFAAASARDPARLNARTTFADTRGSLPRPAPGPILRDFGAPDGLGGALKGIAIATRPRATVTASADGTVVFAGPFRSYGRVLIISVGGGYTHLLAGLERYNVEVGQFVLSGEPVGEMGERAALSAAMGVVETDGPVLYVEFRKDGVPVDPSPWWAKSQGERARG